LFPSRHSALEEYRGKPSVGAKAPTIVNSQVRTREYLTGREVERLMAAARRGRWEHRDATMILIGSDSNRTRQLTARCHQLHSANRDAKDRGDVFDEDAFRFEGVIRSLQVH